MYLYTLRAAGYRVRPVEVRELIEFDVSINVLLHTVGTILLE